MKKMEQLHMYHKGVVFGGDVKCVVCRYFCPNGVNNRCKNCQDHNRYDCEKCHLYAIKVHIDDEKIPKICEYCCGDFRRVNDIVYQKTADYSTKYRLLHNSSDTINICNECYHSSKYNLSETKKRCDLCKKYKHTTSPDKTYFITITQCVNCCIYSDEIKCDDCHDVSIM